MATSELPLQSFTQQLTERSVPLLHMQLEHPFLQALADGTLPRENFEFYIRQDARYLEEYRKVFAYCVTKAADAEESEKFAGLLLNTIKVERELHSSFALQFGVSVEDMETTSVAPTNYAYTRHLLYTAATGTLAETLAALLPCAWIYCRIGKHLMEVCPPGPEHPYRDWIMTYAAPEFDAITTWLCTTLDKYAGDLSQVHLRHLEDLFFISTHYEYFFWDMAWKKEAWLA